MSTVATRRPEPLAGAVPRWASLAAATIVLINVPSGLWRLAIAGLARHETEAMGAPGWGSLFLVVLTVLAEAAAFLAYGLVRRWGEVWPRWIPGLGGRTVPVPAAVVPAALGSLITLLYGVGYVYTTLNVSMDASTWGMVLLNVAYAPLVLWGPLLTALTVHYYRRRRRAPGVTAQVTTPSRGGGRGGRWRRP